MVYSVLNGIGGCLINTPCIASIGHFFLRKRGNATGIAMTSGSIGGIIIPLMLQRLFPMVGFAWGTRILGFILVFLLVVGNLLLRSRLPQKPMGSFKSIAPDFTMFKDLPLAFVTIGIFLMEWVGYLVQVIFTAKTNSEFFTGYLRSPHLHHFLHCLSRPQLRIWLPDPRHPQRRLFLRPFLRRASSRYDRPSEYAHPLYRPLRHQLFRALAPSRRIHGHDCCLLDRLRCRER